jgi:RNA polymerase sigma-70 factor (ECF subfamily)
VLRSRRSTSQSGEVDQSSGDEELVRAAQGGNLQAYNILVTRHERSVFNLCYRMLGSTAEAEDAAQDTFLKAWQAIASFKGGVVRPWLLKIATNRCYDRLRSLSRQPVDPLSGDDDTSELAIPDPDASLDPQMRAERLELSQVLQQALDALPPDQRVAVILCDVHRYSYEEAAEIAGIPAGTIKSRASRGRERLRLHLRQQPETRELLRSFGRFSDE